MIYKKSEQQNISMGFYLSPLCTQTSVTTCVQFISHIWALQTLRKAEKLQKLACSQLKPLYDPIFNGTMLERGWKALRTFGLTSLAHLPDPKCCKCGPKWAKKWPK